MRHVMTKVAAVALILVATAAQAQVEDPVLQPGSPRVGAGRVGLRASFGGGLPVLDTGLGPAGAVGLTYLLSDALALNVDVGARLEVPEGAGANFGFGVAPGLTYYLAPGPLRPFLTGAVGVGNTDVASPGWDLGLNVGAGGEYFFNHNMSAAIKALLPFAFDDVGGTFTFSSRLFTPAVQFSLFF
ncbi:MAG: hypothetical protein L0Y66_18805 [Myxococcaceae bacterium]|nr:hypothetical protein [Myxococcaceae bacterium]MCI0671398.1 hypothetical protein [Myxococcaceae bacterium]